MMKRCFFIGHRETTGSVFPHLCAVVLRHAEEYGVREFIVGRYGNFDSMAANAVLHTKALYPDVSLILLQPYHPAVRTIVLPDGFDNGFYPFSDPVPMRPAIALANRKAIDYCEYLIACVSHPGNSRNCMEYARKREKRGLIRIENIAENPDGVMEI